MPPNRSVRLTIGKQLATITTTLNSRAATLPRTISAAFNGLTSSYAQDSNILKQPGYVIVSPYLFVRPLKRVELGLSAYNVFDKLGIVSLAAASIPASGVANAQVLNGRTVTGSLRLEF